MLSRVFKQRGQPTQFLAERSSDDGGGAPQSSSRKSDGVGFYIGLIIGIIVIRSFIASPFNIPSESMLPTLVDGDYLIATKWPYGFSRYSLPFSVPLISGRLFAQAPGRGDIVIFKAPPANDVDYIKRVIGLPGDEIQVKQGQVWLNGAAVPRVRQPNFIVPVSPNTHCFTSAFQTTDAGGRRVCSYPRFRETLPGGKSYDTLDLGTTPQDDTGVYIVPEGDMFVMGDDRDNSLDSRFPATPNGGVGMVPQRNLVGRASVMIFSTDGSASWLMPWTWFNAARWGRIGQSLS